MSCVRREFRLHLPDHFPTFIAAATEQTFAASADKAVADGMFALCRPSLLAFLRSFRDYATLGREYKADRLHKGTKLLIMPTLR